MVSLPVQSVLCHNTPSGFTNYTKIHRQYSNVMQLKTIYYCVILSLYSVQQELTKRALFVPIQRSRTIHCFVRIIFLYKYILKVQVPSAH